MMDGFYTKSDIKKITKRFRKVAWGRLYWAQNNPNMRRFDSEDVCIVKNGTSCTHYQTVSSLVREIKISERQQLNEHKE